MTKIAIIGGSGAGKSTLALRLGQQLNLTVHHIDKMYWRPNWQKRGESDFLAAAKDVLDQESWVFDGYPAQFWQNHAQALDMVIFVDTNYFVRFWRAFSRDFKNNNKTRPDGPEDCKGVFRREFFHNWLVGWHRNAHRRCLSILHSAPVNVRKIHLTSAKAADTFLADCAKKSATPRA